MKYLFIIILLILTSCGSSASKDAGVAASVVIKDTIEPCGGSATTLEIKNPVGFLSAINMITATPTLSIKQYDTIRCLMLVCDTISGYLPAIIDVGRTSLEQHRRIVYWQYGYKVSQFVAAGWDREDNQHGSYFDFKCYLDADRKPLSKSIVVWQSIEIKK